MVTNKIMVGVNYVSYREAKQNFKKIGAKGERSLKYVRKPRERKSMLAAGRIENNYSLFFKRIPLFFGSPIRNHLNSCLDKINIEKFVVIKLYFSFIFLFNYRDKQSRKIKKQKYVI